MPGITAPRGRWRHPMSKRRTERLLSIVVLLLSSRRYLSAEQIRASVSGYPDAGGVVQADVRAGQGGAARARHPPGDRQEQRVRRRDRLPDPPPGLRAARDPAGGRRGGRARHRLPGLAVGRAGRRRRGRAAQAHGGQPRGRQRGRRRPAQPVHRAAVHHPGAVLRPALGGGPRQAPGHLQLPGPRPVRRQQARARAVGRGQPARPLVRGRPRPGTGTRRGSSA